MAKFLPLVGLEPAAWLTTAGKAVGIAGTGAALIWLLVLITRGRVLPGPRGAWIAGALVCAGVYGLDAAGTFTGDGPSKLIGPPAQLPVVVTLTVGVLLAAGIRLRDIGLRTPSRTPLSAAPATLVGFVALGVIELVPVWNLGVSMLGVPQLTGISQAEAAGTPDAASLTVGIFWSSVVEEFIITGAVVALLAAARRPLGEILLVSALMRAIPHLYTGVPLTVAAFVLGLAFAAMVYRHGQVLPLIAAHFLFDVTSGPPLITVVPPVLELKAYQWLTALVIALVGWLVLAVRYPARPRFRTARPADRAPQAAETADAV
ncbi:CPBP family intramembrane glutamic endopeptidase [Streptomyces nanshensis]|uniref:CPBP family intramembrane glutamic endopeptidase n=1 Tax=Streptomyces nanshensis TaxID=518642 RepID=UPI00114CC9C0|nr:CPBP family intramembrane glutamic endopeptidase [Streptomyces nanshensis]